MKDKIKKYCTNGNFLLSISFLFVFGIAVVIFYFSSYQYICSFLIDDATYYPQVAWNIATGHGSTFDNITLTNGYHPLWCWINVPFSLLGRDAMARLFIFKSVIVATVFLMILVWSSLLRKIGLTSAAIAFFILLMGASYWWSIKVYYSGLETPLVTLMIGLSLLVAHYTYNKPDVKLSILLGIVTAATFLSRLDSVFFIATLYLFWVYKNKRISKEMIVSAFIFTLTCLPYLLWNKINFGNFIPISGIKKSRYGMHDLMANLENMRLALNSEAGRLAKFINIYTISLIIILIFLIIYWAIKIYKHKPGNEKKYELFSIVYISTAMHFFYNVFFMSEIMVNWYQYLIYLSIFMLLATMVDKAPVSGILPYIRSSLYFCLLILFILMLKSGFDKFPRDLKVATVEAATYARNNTPKDTIYGMCDPGIFRFVSDRRTIAFNGLIGNRDIMNLILSGHPEKIVEKYNVEYYVIIISADDFKQLGIKPFYLSRQFIFPWPRKGEKNTYVAIFGARDYFAQIRLNP